jgi:uncharacterized protein YjbJ (UPF0337 family)
MISARSTHSPGILSGLYFFPRQNYARFYVKKIEPHKASFVVAQTQPQTESSSMDREHVKGAAEKAKGTIKDTAGKLTGDKKLQSEGKFDKAKGSAHNVAGDIKDAVKQSDE